MKIEDIELLFSKSRIRTYYFLFPNDKQKAIEYYQLNTQIAEAFYPLLSNFEVVLRNAIHNSFSKHFKTEDWYENIYYPELVDQVKIAKSKISLSKKEFTIDKLIAELTLGFWTALFNKKYAKDFWKPLMYAFPLVEKEKKIRNSISYKLNNIRKFRNRIFHYEPICTNLIVLEINHKNILEILGWINEDVVVWTKVNDRFDELYLLAKKLKSV